MLDNLSSGAQKDFFVQSWLEYVMWLRSTRSNDRRRKKLDIDCVLERTRGMLAEVTFDPTGQV